MPSIAQRINRLKRDKRRGAAELALAAVRILEDVCVQSKEGSPVELRNNLRKAAKGIVSARPSMSAVRTSVLLALQDIHNARSRKEAGYRLTKFRRELSSSAEKCAKNAARLLGDGKTVLTNSYSSSVLRAAGFAKGNKVRFIVAESRPLFEGRKTARELARMGFAVTLISDAACSIFIEEADLVLVGADTILPDGSLVNKVGTKLIALAAYGRTIPFHAVTQRVKIAPDRKHFEIEEKEGREISRPIGKVTMRNPYFDVTPSKYVTAIITEDGIMHAKEVRRFAQRLKRLRL
jgi:translation initiation factor 2B subunit (eIF-2B alpha/beta/delta family)